MKQAQQATDTFTNLANFETLNQQELMDVNGGKRFYCSFIRFCPSWLTDGKSHPGMMA